MTQNALVLTDSSFATGSAKTAHGLLRGPSRFHVAGIIDAKERGRKAKDVIGFGPAELLCYASIKEALSAQKIKIDCVVIGVAPVGGRLTAGLVNDLKEAIGLGLDIVNGLHEGIAEQSELAALLKNSKSKVYDIRRAKPLHELHSWTGEVYKVKAKRVAVLGMDCAIGKRTTTQMLMLAGQARGERFSMVYTGQTGWMLGLKHGLFFDATPNDFCSGELEHAIVSCDRDEQPTVILLEGQSSLQNPKGPCGSEFLLSGAAKLVVLQHAPGREFYKGAEGLCPLASLSSEIALIRAYGARVLAVTLNMKGIEPARYEELRRSAAAESGLPVFLPQEEGLSALVDLILKAE